MIIKLEKVINCTSEHPLHPASNLLKQRENSSWKCGKPGLLLASVTFQLTEASTITGLDIGNYKSCIVIVTASTSEEPDNWISIVNHQFMTHDEAANGKFRDQVQLFTKKELDAETIKIKFNRVKVTCMQSANLRELFGLTFIVFRTEIAVEMSNEILGRFKLRNEADNVDSFKDRCMKLFPKKESTYKETLAEKIKTEGANAFAKRQEEPREPMKRPILEKMEKNSLKDAEEEKKIDTAKQNSDLPRTPFGDVINSRKEEKVKKKVEKGTDEKNSSLEEAKIKIKKGGKCSKCGSDEDKDEICDICKLPPRPKPLSAERPAKKPKIIPKQKKEFAKLFEGVSFALSGYVNPQRDEIRRKALKMGGKYVADPNTTNNKCTHLICAFKNTPKSQQLKGHTHIVSHKFIEECYDKKMRFPWRRFALDKKERSEPESEEEIEAGSTSSEPPDPYQQDTDSDSSY